MKARGLTVAYDREPVLDGLDLAIAPAQVTAIVGANGCGKSTLLRALARLVAPRKGAVLLDGREIRELPSRDVARRLGVLPQSPLAPEGLTVEDLVARGRYPHQGLFRQWSHGDELAVEDALAATAMQELRARPVDELSGGQRQRAWIAMTLAQETELLLLDEPTTFLDLAHQLEVLDLLDHLVAERGRTVVMVLHDLNQACRYADRLVARARRARARVRRAGGDRRRRLRPRRLRARCPHHRGPRHRHPAVPSHRRPQENPMRLILTRPARPAADRVRLRRRDVERRHGRRRRIRSPSPSSTSTARPRSSPSPSGS